MTAANLTPSATAQNAPARPVFDAEKMVNGGQTALIRLDDKVYTLRITRAGKLILTK